MNDKEKKIEEEFKIAQVLDNITETKEFVDGEQKKIQPFLEALNEVDEDLFDESADDYDPDWDTIPEGVLIPLEDVRAVIMESGGDPRGMTDEQMLESYHSIKDGEYFTEATYVGGIQHLKEGKTKRALRIEIDNTEATHKTEPHCHAVIYDDGVPVDKIKNHPNTSRIQIRLDTALYLGNRRLTLEQRNKFIEEMKQPAFLEGDDQDIKTTVWNLCRNMWNASSTVRRVTIKTMPSYETLAIL